MDGDDVALTAAGMMDAVTALRDRAEAAVADGHDGADSFVGAAYDALRWMESLPPEHFLHWPSKFGYWRAPAPAALLLESALRKVFNKVIRESSNGSGLAVEGPRGVGKTHLLQAVVLASALLLPSRVVSSYVDYKSVPSSLTPGATLCHALARAPPPRDGRRFTVPAAPSVASAIREASATGRVLLFVADEISHVYLDDDVWEELHSLATKTEHVCFVADSGSKLKAMVERRPDDVPKLLHHFPQLANRPKLPQSLNGTKLKVMSLLPLTTREQYWQYLLQRPYAAVAASGAAAAVSAV